MNSRQDRPDMHLLLDALLGYVITTVRMSDTGILLLGR